MRSIVVLSEEPSAAIVVRTLAQRLVPHAVVTVVEHEGKSDPKQSFPRKIRAWVHPPDAQFIVLTDNDGSDCRALKAELIRAVPRERLARTRVRLIMHELEAWYLGDLEAMRLAGVISAQTFAGVNAKAKYRDPDSLANAKDELFKLCDRQGQRLLAREIAPHLDPVRSRSASFRLFVRTLLDG